MALFRPISTWFLLTYATFQLCFLFRTAPPNTYQNIKHNYLEHVRLQFLLKSHGSNLKNLIYKSSFFMYSSLKLTKYIFIMHQHCVAINYIMPLKGHEVSIITWTKPKYLLFFFEGCVISFDLCLVLRAQT